MKHIVKSFITAFAALIILDALYAGDNSDTIELSNKGSKLTGKKTNGFTFDPRFDRIIESRCSEYGIDPYLVKCIIKVESDFKPGAVSPAGAAGLMQLMQETAREYGVIDRTDPESNIRAGVAHLSYIMKEFKNDVPTSLAAYHAGIGRVKRMGGVPPIRSTILYVNHVMKFYTGGGDYSVSVKKLYTKIDRDGTITITDR